VQQIVLSKMFLFDFLCQVRKKYLLLLGNVILLRIYDCLHDKRNIKRLRCKMQICAFMTSQKFPCT